MSDDERTLFRTVATEQFAPAAQRHAAQPRSARPKGLRIKSVRGARGMWEMTWSFAGPDGRATFEWIEIDDEPAIRWRRVGSYAIFSEP